MTVTATRRTSAIAMVSLGVVLSGTGLSYAVTPPESTATYVVQVEPGADDAVAADLADLGVTPLASFDQVVDGFAAELTEDQVDTLLDLPLVADVTVEHTFAITDMQVSATWGLDRIDQRNLPLDGAFHYPASAGSGVPVYVVDTGVSPNTGFGGRLAAGFTPITDGIGTADCHGHGTHVAGTAASTGYGVAKAATVVPIRVLDCTGHGTTSQILAGLDWIAAQHGPQQPGVVNLSLGGPHDAALDNAIAGLVADGLTVVVSAGNDATDACTQSPASEPTALTTAASTSTDARADFSNVGACVDLFAPGESIRSLSAANPTGSLVMSGTSMAAPHVAGVAALYLGQVPTANPAQVTTAILDATVAVISGAGPSTTTRLLSAAVGPQSPVSPLPGGSPRGGFDRAVGTLGGVSLSGWAIDPDTTAPAYVWVDISGQGRHLLANVSRPDVGAAFAGFGDEHGFSATIPAGGGQRTVCLTVVNTGLGGNTSLGCRTVTVPGGSPVGNIELVRGSTGQVEVRGWAIDPDRSSPVYVWVDINGAGRHLLASENRPDLASAFPGYGAGHGFAATLPASGGPQRVCLLAVNTGAGSNTSLGCRTVVLPGGSPIGNVESVSAGPGTLTVKGWVLDPDTTAAVYVWVDVSGLGRHVLANADRPDVAAALPGYGSNHGLASTIAVPAGRHRVCLTAVDVGQGENTSLGCRTVVVAP